MYGYYLCISLNVNFISIRKKCYHIITLSWISKTYHLHVFCFLPCCLEVSRTQWLLNTCLREVKQTNQLFWQFIGIQWDIQVVSFRLVFNFLLIALYRERDLFFCVFLRLSMIVLALSKLTLLGSQYTCMCAHVHVPIA